MAGYNGVPIAGFSILHGNVIIKDVQGTVSLERMEVERLNSMISSQGSIAFSEKANYLGCTLTFRVPTDSEADQYLKGREATETDAVPVIVSRNLHSSDGAKIAQTTFAYARINSRNFADNIIMSTDGEDGQNYMEYKIVGVLRSKSHYDSVRPLS